MKQFIKRFFCFVAFAGFFALQTSCVTHPTSVPEFSGATPLQWSVRLADSEMARRGEQPGLETGRQGQMGLHRRPVHAVAAQTERTGDRSALMSNSPKTPSVRSSRRRGTSTVTSRRNDQLDAHRIRARPCWRSGRSPTTNVIKRPPRCLRKQLDTQPRTGDGGFWHKQRYPNQMWLDGLYMGAPFYAEYAKLFNEPAADFDDVAKQIRLVATHTYDPETGLFYHGWDESKSQPWANRITGTSSNFWGRAIGWYAMALVDVLDYFPTNHPARPEIIATFQKLCGGRGEISGSARPAFGSRWWTRAIARAITWKRRLRACSFMRWPKA